MKTRILGCVLVMGIGCGGQSPPGACETVLEEQVVEAGSVRFGRAMSGGHDADGDGHPDVLIGDPSTDQSEEIGRASLVSGATGAVLRVWESDQPGDRFGAHVALGPDADGDGLGDVLIAAPAHDSYRGQVTLWSGATGARLATWDGADDAGLGVSISLGPDVDGDGLADVLLADQLIYDVEVDGDIEHARRGRVYLHAGAGGALLATLDAPELDTRFGVEVRLGPDVDGDGAGDLLITDPEGGDRRSGAVHLVSGATRELLHTWESDAQTYYFGSAVAIGPDVGGDGVPDVAIAMTDTETIEERVVVYAGATDEVVQIWRDDNWRVLQGDALAITEDLDGDGRGEVAIAANMVLAGADEPAMAVFLYAGADGAELASWSHAEHRYFGATGVAVAADGDGCGALIAIGVTEDDPIDGPQAGRIELRRFAP